MASGSGLRRAGDAHDSGLLTILEAAQRLGTSPRFVRRLIAERRIAFTRIGRGSDVHTAGLIEDRCVDDKHNRPAIPVHLGCTSAE